MEEIESNAEETWNEARLTGIARVLRVGMSGLLILGVVVLFLLIDAELRSSSVILLLFAALIAASVYDILNVIRSRLYWNDRGIRRSGLFREGRLHLWQDLTYVEKSMHHRATVLTFKSLWKIKIYWAYRAHRELAALAKQKRKDAKASRKKRKEEMPDVDIQSQAQTAETKPTRIEPQMSDS